MTDERDDYCVWLIERGEGVPEYLSFIGQVDPYVMHKTMGAFAWSKDAYDAIQFRRAEDASRTAAALRSLNNYLPHCHTLQNLRYDDTPPVRIVEHAFIFSGPKGSGA